MLYHPNIYAHNYPSVIHIFSWQVQTLHLRDLLSSFTASLHSTSSMKFEPELQQS